MKYTENYNLKKPEQSDSYNIDDFNYNSEIIDKEFARLEKLFKVEDISNDFLVSPQSLFLSVESVSVFKQGNLISGSILFTGDFVSARGADAKFTINDKYVSKYIVNANVHATNGTDTKFASVEAFINYKTLYIETLNNSNVSVANISFSYFCQ